jgi:hypothetical protein
MVETDIMQLQRELRYLKDRLAIQDLIARHARGHDRHDSQIIASCYWEDGIDQHGNAVNPGPKYADWINQEHTVASTSHLHFISTHNCEIQGDEAHCESYVIVGLLDHGEKTSKLVCGRYIDRLERRDNQWRIALRRGMVDFIMAGDASMLQHPMFKSMGYIRGTWDESDISYQRPLELETPATKW